MNTKLSDMQKKIDEIAGRLKLNSQQGNIINPKQLSDSYHVLFNGTPEAAKNFASHLAVEVNKEVYTIDQSTLVSKYIGETEKNLDHLFAGAEQKGWILLFDEADALFGKRSDIQDSHDKYANEEISYLLERITKYNGLVILATNNEETIDPHWLNRFHTILHFPPVG